MQGYTYVKGEHYPVEHLVFETAPEHVQEFPSVLSFNGWFLEWFAYVYTIFK